MWKYTAVAAGVAAAAWAVIAIRRARRTEGVKGTGKAVETEASSSQFTMFESARLREFCVRVFRHYGVPTSDAELAADVLASADTRGIDSHGIARLHTYFELLQAGRINPTPNVRVVHRTPSTATVDGDNGLGLVVGPKANELAMEMAAEVGSGWVSVRNTNHFGIAGYYCLEATKRDMIGVAMTNTTKLVAPFNGIERMLGTNPIAVAIPAGEEPPIVCDMATSAVAYGKVEIAHRLGKDLPHGWAIDKHGNPATNPAAMKDGGALLPLGSDANGSGHKGYCLSAWVDIMCAVLSGANWGPFAPPFTLRDGVNRMGEERVGKGIGHFFGAWRVDGFRDKAECLAETDRWIRRFRDTTPAPGQRVLIPGDPERLAAAKRLKEGIPVPAKVVEDMDDIVKHTGIAY